MSVERVPVEHVFLAVPPERELAGARNLDGSPVVVSLSGFVYEYAFCEWDGLGGENVANPIWRKSAEWIAAYLRLSAIFAAPVTDVVELRADDHARLFAAVQAARIPAEVHRELMIFVAAVATPLSTPPAARKAPAAYSPDDDEPGAPPP